MQSREFKNKCIFIKKEKEKENEKEVSAKKGDNEKKLA